MCPLEVGAYNQTSVCRVARRSAHPHWAERLTATDMRALTPLIWEHVNPYGRFELNIETRLDLSPNGPDCWENPM
jgi:hypothetical protein